MHIIELIHFFVFSYSSRDLKGLRVEHSTEHFGDGETVLTLKDQDILGWYFVQECGSELIVCGSGFSKIGQCGSGSVPGP